MTKLEKYRVEVRRQYADWPKWQEQANYEAVEAARRERRNAWLTAIFGTPLLLAMFAAAVVLCAVM